MSNKKYHIITIGCQMNKSDSERIAGYLEGLDYKQIADKYQADLVVINTCGVRQSAEDRVYGIIPRIKCYNPNAKVVLTGCLSERRDVQKKLKDKVDIWLPIINLPRFSKMLRVASCKLREDNYLKLRPKYNSQISAFVPIGNGCNNFCSYCVVPYARGREVYRPVKDILNEVKNLVKKSYKEIVLIAQNVNSYKHNANAANNTRMPRIVNNANKNKYIDFVTLLKMVNNIKGNFWIRFATSHPKDMSDELIKAIAGCDKVCEHIHLPVQSGDNEILQKMNRNYAREHYLNLIRGIRRAIPNVAITTDIIVGFPGETKEQFNNTVKLFKEVKFDMAYIAQYSPRPGTAAEKFEDDVPKAEKKRREEELMKILRRTALDNNKKYIGKVVDVLVEGKNRKGEWHGKTRTNKNVKCQMSNAKCHVGEFIKVKIKKAWDFGLEGEFMGQN